MAMSEQIQKSGNITEDIALSNEVLNKEIKKGKLTNFRIVPRLTIYGITGDDINNSNKNLSYRDAFITYIDENGNPYVNINKNISKEYDKSLINKYTVVKSVNEILKLNPHQKFLIKTEDKNGCEIFYVCKATYNLIASLKIGSLYNKDIIVKEDRTLKNLKNTNLNRSIEYRVNDKGIMTRPEQGKFQKFSPKSYISTIALINIFVCILILKTAEVSVLGSPLLTILATTLGSLFIPIFIILSLIYSGAFIKNKMRKIDRFNMSDNIYSKKYNNITNQYNLDNRMYDEVEVTINSEKGIIESTDRNISWNITYEDNDIYTQNALNFFIEMGIDKSTYKFNTYMVSENCCLPTNNYLKSNCGNWYLTPKNITRYDLEEYELLNN